MRRAAPCPREARAGAADPVAPTSLRSLYAGRRRLAPARRLRVELRDYPARVQLLILVAAIAAISWSAPLIRLAEAPVLVIAALRISIAAAPMAGAAAIRRGEELRALGRDGLAGRDLPLLALTAAVLAGHFWAWVAAVERTSVITSVVLVTLQPVFAALGAWLLLRERPTSAALLGSAIALGGVLLLAADDLGDLGSLLGDGFALLAALLMSAYFVAGRRARRRLSTLSYGAVVYSGAAAILLVAMVGAGEGVTGHPREAYLLIAALALGPQLIGHNALNWSLGSLSAATVAAATLGEPVGATLIAALLMDELPSALEVVGGAVVLVGVWAAFRSTARAPVPASGSRTMPR
jgi:drug/metabolite transporter (DMT)-like permease